MENNIPFNQNWIRVRANSSGEIVEFKRNWYEGELPDARLAIPEELARNTLEKGREPSLLYRKMGKGTGSDGKIRDEYRLVYDYRKTDPQLVDAITGRVIDAGGNEVTSKTQLRILENENPASIPLAANEHKVALTQEQAISSAIKLVQSSFRGQLKNIYLVEPPPPQWSMEDLFKHQIDYEVEFGWLEGGIIIQDATFQVRVHPGTGQAHFVDEEPVRAPAIVDKSPKRVHVSVAKQTEQANKTLELVYYQPSGYGENGKPRLIYRLTGDYGVVDARNGEWLSFK